MPLDAQCSVAPEVHGERRKPWPDRVALAGGLATQKFGPIQHTEDPENGGLWQPQRLCYLVKRHRVRRIYDALQCRERLKRDRIARFRLPHLGRTAPLDQRTPPSATGKKTQHYNKGSRRGPIAS